MRLRRKVDDASTVRTGTQRWQEQKGEQERGDEIGLKGGFQVVFGERRWCVENAGVVDESVDRLGVGVDLLGKRSDTGKGLQLEVSDGDLGIAGAGDQALLDAFQCVRVSAGQY